MASLALRVALDAAQAEALGDALLELGAQSVDLEPPDAPRVRLCALFAAGAEPLRALAEAAHRAGLPLPPNAEAAPVEDDDWVRRSQAQFEPLALGRLWIGASWHEPPAEGFPARVRIDPGLAFGTGSHASTRLCLGYLERTLTGGERLLDYGCGSGILAIAAAKLGAARVEGTDIDPQAVAVARENAARNFVSLNACLPDALGPGTYDVVVANILAQPLVALAPVLSAACRQGGRLALAGLLEAQAEEVALAYAAQFEIGIAERLDGWALVAGVKR